MASYRSYVIRRIILIPVSIFVLTTIVFFLIRVLPGASPVRVLNLKLSPAQVARLNAQFGLNKSLWDQYLLFIQNIFIKFDFGSAIQSNTPIINDIIPRFMATIELSILASIIGVPLGILIGTYSGKYRGQNRDHLLRIYTIAVYSIPIFWMGIWMQVIFSQIFQKTTIGSLGWIPSNLRTGTNVTSYIHRITGIYSVDTLLFSGPPGWDVIYYVIFAVWFLSFLIAYFYYTKIYEKEVNQQTLIMLGITFVISEVAQFLVFNKGLISLDAILGTYTFLAKGLLFFFSFFIWLYFYTTFENEAKGYFKKIFVLAILLSLIPLIPYFYESWFVIKTDVSVGASYTGLTLFQDVFSHLLLPGLTLGLLLSGVVARLVRTNMVTVVYEQFIDSSKARGISDRKITYDYALKNATIPSIPIIGLQFAILLGGAILTETTFSYFGLGLYLYNAIVSKDYPQIQAAVILFSICVAIVSFISDIIYASIDKRVRL